MTSIIAKAEFENMLDLLNSNTLIDINRRIVAEEPYSWGRTPLLKYAPEALADFATLFIGRLSHSSTQILLQMTTSTNTLLNTLLFMSKQKLPLMRPV